MTNTMEPPLSYPFNRFDGLELSERYAQALSRTGLTRITLPFDGDAWLATRYEDVRLVLSDRRFSRAEATQRERVPRAFPRVAGGIVIMDPPELTRLRKLALQAFTVRRVEGLRPHVREVADGLIDDMLRRGAPADLVADYALPIPMSVICELLGVPLADQPRFKIWNDSLLSTNALSAEETQQNLGELSHYIMALIDERRARPRDDLISAMIQARDQDDRLSQGELVLLCIAILVAGYEGVSSHIPNFLYTLLSRPDTLDRLRSDPDRMADAVEELLRLIPLASAAMFVHFAREDVQVGDTLVRAGEAVFASVGAANRDPHRFHQPDHLDIDRDASGHFAFGHGMHHCIGAGLARVELQEALGVLLRRLPEIHLCGEIEWKTKTFFRGPRRMPVAW
ncbi:cytochrome P450 [Alloalcanivorax dieselolei]|nr:cytochrome P450 [Alloalcanivorax dieselolei]